jgi:GNAT superfamily N-acetyltransferase
MIREITKTDFESFWPTFSQVIKAQETYAFEPDMSLEQAFAVWCEAPLKTFVYIEHDEVLATYYLKANAAGPSKHICNCGYMVSNQAQGRGLATLLCEHSQETAIELGFKAMQFNNVVSSNEIAVKLWQKLGYDIIGTIPRAYLHKQHGMVDSYIMYKCLSTNG